MSSKLFTVTNKQQTLSELEKRVFGLAIFIAACVISKYEPGLRRRLHKVQLKEIFLGTWRENRVELTV